MIERKFFLVGLLSSFTLTTACGGDDGGDEGAGTESAGSDTSAEGGTAEGGTAEGGTAEGGTAEGGTAEGGSDSGGPETCPGASEGTAAEGDACTANADCASGICLLFSDVPTPDDATCAAPLDDCNTRVTGTVYDFTTGEAVGGADVRVVKALEAVTNPEGAAPVVEAQSGDDGTIDVTSDMPITSPIGIVALVSGGDYFITATGVASPVEGSSYAPGTGIHEFWAVPSASLTDWSTELGNDAEIDAALLPLGEAGGVVGFVRDATGAAVEGATVASIGDTTDSLVRYLADDGTFNTDGTGPSGIFVILNPGVAEEFEVSLDGSATGATGSAGSTAGAIFTLVMTVTE